MTNRTLSLLGLVTLTGATSVAAQQVARVDVSPATVTIAVNQQTGVLATAYDGTGNVLPTVEIHWASANNGVVRVETDPAVPGLATLIGVAPGVASVTARAGGRSGTVTVQVLAVGGGAGPGRVGTGAPTLLRIDPNNVQLLPGESRQLAPVFLKDDGSFAAPTPISWRSLAPAIATVNDAGLITGIAQGQGLAQLTNPSGLTATAPVEVSRADLAFSVPIVSLSPGTEVQLEIVVPSQDDRKLPNNAVTWRSTNEAIVRVSQLGAARAEAAGEARVIIEGFLQADTVTVRVHRPVSAVNVTPQRGGPVVVPFGGHRQFEVAALAADGTPVPDAPMIWTVRDTSVARYDPASNRLIGRKIGETQLHLRGPGPDVIEATWSVSVVAGGLLINRQAVGVGIGDTVSLTASFTDQAGRPISPASAVTWSSSAPGVADVTGAGLVTGVGHGHARILAATPWDAADTMDVFVQGEIVIASTRAGSPDLFAFDRVAPARLNRITDDPAVEVNGAWSPDGSWIAFTSTRDGNPELYLVRPDGSESRRLTTTPDVSEDAAAWTPDGRHIVYHAQPRGGRADVWIMNADGSNPRQLTTGSATNFQPALSPDGGTIAFTSTRDGNYDIWLMRLDGSEQRNVTRTPGKESKPRYFPDGTLGYIQEQRQGDRPTQVVVRKVLATGEVTPITPVELQVTEFAIAPSGDLLIVQTTSFAAQGGMQNRLFLVPLTGGQPTEVPREPGEQQLAPAFRRP